MKINNWAAENDVDWPAIDNQPYIYIVFSEPGKSFSECALETVKYFVRDCILGCGPSASVLEDIQSYQLAIVITVDCGKPERATIDIKSLINEIKVG
jgi:hypothetical protein